MVSIVSAGGHRTTTLSSTTGHIKEHEELIDALQARDGRLAARLTRMHMAEARNRIVTALKRSAVIV